MLEITVKETELYQPGTNKFVQIPECTLTLEHSLISLAKWESKWQIPYFSDKKKTKLQDLDYIRCMVVGPIKNDNVFLALTPEDLQTIYNYMDNPMTATTFTQHTNRRPPKKEVITAETLYARMCTHNISIECQKWHLNRLLTLIKVCDLQNSPRDKMDKKQTAMWNAEQNAKRKAKYNTRG